MTTRVLKDFLYSLLPKNFRERDFLECHFCHKKFPISNTKLVVLGVGDDKSLENVCLDCASKPQAV